MVVAEVDSVGGYGSGYACSCSWQHLYRMMNTIKINQNCVFDLSVASQRTARATVFVDAIRDGVRIREAVNGRLVLVVSLQVELPSVIVLGFNGVTLAPFMFRF